MGRRKEENNKNKTKFIIAVIVVVVLIIIAIVVGIRINKNNDKEEIEKDKKINMNAEAVVYYSINNMSETALQEDGQTFSNNIKISWIEGCTGVIKKDGKEFSKTNGTALLEEGKYEITVTSPKNVVVRKSLNIDSTPPEVEIKENSDGTYSIVFKDIDDIETAILYRRKNKDDKDVETTDLKEKGLQQQIEIKEKGTYILECTDKVENMTNKKFRIEG